MYIRLLLLLLYVSLESQVFTVTSSANAGPNTLREAIELAHIGNTPHSIEIVGSIASITLSEPLPPLNTSMNILYTGIGSVEINGGGQRPFFAKQGSHNIHDVTFVNCRAQGGNGGSSEEPGGGGAGLGGAIFVHEGSSVTLTNPNFFSCSAQGGNGGVRNTNNGFGGSGAGGGMSGDGGSSSGFGGCGGGGMVGNGGSSPSSGDANGGGGGAGYYGNGATSTQSSSGGGCGGGGSILDSTTNIGQNGSDGGDGFSGGGGGGFGNGLGGNGQDTGQNGSNGLGAGGSGGNGSEDSVKGIGGGGGGSGGSWPSLSQNGGNGGFGAGGGGLGDTNGATLLQKAGDGGFGGGGGSSGYIGNGGNGGFGGGGGGSQLSSGGDGGFAGGGGSGQIGQSSGGLFGGNGGNGGGGGGALGGSCFIQSDASLTLIDPLLGTSSVTGGNATAGSNASNGAALGDQFFLMHDALLVFDTSTPLVLNAQIEGDGTSSTNGGVTKKGASSLSFTQLSSQSYSGVTTILEGSLIVSNENTLGSAQTTIELSGGELTLNGTYTSISKDILVSGSGGKIAGIPNTTTQINGTITGSSQLTLLDNSSYDITDALAFTGDIVVENSTLLFDQTSSYPISTLIFDGSTLKINGTATHIIPNQIESASNVMPSVFEVNSPSATLNGVITGNNFEKNGSGDLIITNASNTFNTMSLNSGNIVASLFAVSSALGNSITVSSGANLSFVYSTPISSTDSIIQGDGVVTFNPPTNGTVLVTMPMSGALEIEHISSGRVELQAISSMTNRFDLFQGELELASQSPLGSALLNINTGEVFVDVALSLPNTIEISTIAQFFLQGNAMTFLGGIGGSGSLDVRGSGNVTFSQLSPISGGIDIYNSRVYFDGVSKNDSTLYSLRDASVLEMQNNDTISTPLALFDATYIDSVGVNEITGSISGSALEKRGAGILTISGSTKGYTGNTVVKEGTLYVNQGALPSSTTVDLTSNIVFLSGNQTLAGVIDSATTSPGVIDARNIELTFDIQTSFDIFNGHVLGSNSLHKEGNGGLELTRDSTFSGSIHVQNGTLRISQNAEYTDSDVVIYQNGVLETDGSFSSIDSSGVLDTMSIADIEIANGIELKPSSILRVYISNIPGDASTIVSNQVEIQSGAHLEVIAQGTSQYINGSVYPIIVPMTPIVNNLGAIQGSFSPSDITIIDPNNLINLQPLYFTDNDIGKLAIGVIPASTSAFSINSDSIKRTTHQHLASLSERLRNNTSQEFALAKSLHPLLKTRSIETYAHFVGSYGRYNDIANDIDISFRMNGYVAGLEFFMSEDSLIGLEVSQLATRAESMPLFINSKLKGVYISAFSQWKLLPFFSLDSSLGYGYSSVRESRFFQQAVNTVGNTESNTLSMLISGKCPIFWSNCAIVPEVTSTFLHSRVNPYKEKSNDGITFDLSRDVFSDVDIIAGSTIMALHKHRGFTIVPKIFIAYMHTFDIASRTTKITFEDQPTNSRDINIRDTEESIILTTVGLSVMWDDFVTVYGSCAKGFSSLRRNNFDVQSGISITF